MLTNCRLCLAKDASFVISNGQTAVRIMSCIGLEVNPDDKMPELICPGCRLRLEEFYYFRKRCHAADRRLRSLKRHGRISGGQRSRDRCDSGEEDEEALYLKDVAHCSTTACSENNAKWRREATQLIRREIDAYKKELLDLCKQQVREEIEQQVRNEVGELLLAKAKKDCRLNVLDDLFYEMETFFVHKRNEAVREGLGSDVETPDVGSLSTIVDLSEESSHGDYQADLEAGDVTILEVLDDESSHQSQTSVTVSAEIHASKKDTAAILPLAMVEINMQNPQHSHLRENLESTHFLPAAVAAETKINTEDNQFKKMAYASPRRVETPHTNLRERICRKHGQSSKSKKRSSIKSKGQSCYRCRLRSTRNLNKTTS